MKFLDSIKAPFVTPTAQDVARRQLAEAERQALDHRSTAEYQRASAEGHDAMAAMYESRAERLRGVIEPERLAISIQLPTLHGLQRAA